MIERLRTHGVNSAKTTLFPDSNPPRIVREKVPSKCLVSGGNMSSFGKKTHVASHIYES